MLGVGSESTANLPLKRGIDCRDVCQELLANFFYLDCKEYAEESRLLSAVHAGLKARARPLQPSHPYGSIFSSACILPGFRILGAS